MFKDIYSFKYKDYEFQFFAEKYVYRMIVIKDSLILLDERVKLDEVRQFIREKILPIFQKALQQENIVDRNSIIARFNADLDQVKPADLLSLHFSMSYKTSSKLEEQEKFEERDVSIMFNGNLSEPTISII